MLRALLRSNALIDLPSGHPLWKKGKIYLLSSSNRHLQGKAENPVLTVGKNVPVPEIRPPGTTLSWEGSRYGKGCKCD